MGSDGPGLLRFYRGVRGRRVQVTGGGSVSPPSRSTSDDLRLSDLSGPNPSLQSTCTLVSEVYLG